MAFACRSILFLSLTLAAATSFADTPSTSEMIAKAMLAALNSKNPKAPDNFVQAYCTKSMVSIEPEMKRISKSGPHILKKLVFTAPYEFIAEVQNSKFGTEHLTCFFDGHGKMRAMMLLPDGR